MTMPDNQSIAQMGYVVVDLQAAMAKWADTLGVGPFRTIDHVTIEGGCYRGSPTAVDISVALAESGDIQIELIEQHNDVASCYRDLFAPGTQGLHHVAIHTSEYDAEVARYESLGCPLAFGGTYQGTRFAYMDTSANLGIMVEVVESQP